ncbi:MAG: glycerophosphodiester phosphodiesterase family protein [Bacteroidaceae bacterium]|nr:glycerophosphodiester phosphodiesterase family protein [Bacteroidaceae bacterium]
MMNRKRVTILLLAALFLQIVRAAAPQLVIAHRGGAALGAENTLSCIEAGIAAGADAIEVDVRLTKDGKLVVCHDASVDATTNGSGRVAEMTLRQVQSLRALGHDGTITADSVPTLAQVLSLVHGRCGLLVEVKSNSGKGVEEKLIEEILAADAAQWVAVQSFSDAVLMRLNELNAPFPLEKLIVFKLPLLPLIFDGSLRFFSLDKYNFISSFNFKCSFFPSRLARRLRNCGKKVKVWTLCAPSDNFVADVDAVITDCPHLWKR